MSGQRYAFEPFASLDGVLRGEPIRIMPAGVFYRGERKLDITEERLKAIAANFKAGLPRFRVPINENHAGIGKVGQVNGVEYISAGSDGPGLYATQYELTDEGRKLIESKRFDATSPEIVWSLLGGAKYQDPQTGEYHDNVMVGLALTDKPYFGHDNVALFCAQSDQFYNPEHDEKGRFAPGGGAGAGEAPSGGESSGGGEEDTGVLGSDVKGKWVTDNRGNEKFLTDAKPTDKKALKDYKELKENSNSVSEGEWQESKAAGTYTMAEGNRIATIREPNALQGRKGYEVNLKSPAGLHLPEANRGRNQFDSLAEAKSVSSRFLSGKNDSSFIHHQRLIKRIREARYGAGLEDRIALFSAEGGAMDGEGDMPMMKKVKRMLTDMMALFRDMPDEKASDAQTTDQFAVWTVAFMNDLPDSAFLHIEPGGEKDEDGRTVPRSLRHFPYKDVSGKVDLPHLRNALARIPQSSLSAEVKQRVIAKARRIAEDAGIGVSEEASYEEATMADDKKSVPTPTPTPETFTVKAEEFAALKAKAAEVDALSEKFKALEAQASEAKTKADKFAADLAAEKHGRRHDQLVERFDAMVGIPEKAETLADKILALEEKDADLAAFFTGLIERADKALVESELFSQKGSARQGETETFESAVDKVLAEQFKGDVAQYSNAMEIVQRTRPELAREYVNRGRR